MFICLNAKMFKCNKGFTLVEIIVAITIFTLLMLATFGVYLTSFRKHRQALMSQIVNEELQYVIEIISRDIRESYLMARSIAEERIFLDHPTKNINDATCTPDNCCAGCLQYRFNLANNRIEVQGRGDISFVALTSPRMEIERVFFNIDTAAYPAPDQPRITILMRAKARADTLGTSRIILQTTITQKEVVNLYRGGI